MSSIARRAIKVADAMTVIWRVVEENRRLKEQLAQLEDQAKITHQKIKRLSRAREWPRGERPTQWSSIKEGQNVAKHSARKVRSWI